VDSKTHELLTLHVPNPAFSTTVEISVQKRYGVPAGSSPAARWL
jgi:hypothetical protein